MATQLSQFTRDMKRLKKLTLSVYEASKIKRDVGNERRNTN